MQYVTLTKGRKNRNLGSDNMDGRANENMFCEKKYFSFCSKYKSKVVKISSAIGFPGLFLTIELRKMMGRSCVVLVGLNYILAN